MYKYLTISILYSYRFSSRIMAISYPYRFLRLNPKLFSGLKSPYRVWQFCIPVRLDPKPLSGLKSPCIAWQFCTSTGFLRLDPNSMCGLKSPYRV